MKQLSRRKFAQATVAALGCVGLTPVTRIATELPAEPPLYSFLANAIPQELAGRNERRNKADFRAHNKKLRTPG